MLLVQLLVLVLLLATVAGCSNIHNRTIQPVNSDPPLSIRNVDAESAPKAEVGWCQDGWSEETLTAVKDAYGDVYRVVRLDVEMMDTAGAVSHSSCGVLVRAKLKGEVDGPWAGYVQHPVTGEHIRASRGLRGSYRWLEG